VSASFGCFAGNNTGKPSAQLVTGEGYFPYIYKGIIHGGWSRALIKETFALMNVDIEVDILPWKRGLKWTKEGRFLATFPYVYSASRADDFLFSVTINQVPVRLFVTQESGIKKVEKLKGKRLCIPHGYSVDTSPQGIVGRFNLSINRAKDGLGCVKHVQKGWSDVGLTNGYIVSEQIKTGFDEDKSIYILPEELTSVPLYLIISKQYPNAQEWIDRFNSAFAELSATGKKQQIDLQFTKLLSAR
jgi:polar amino acid transport system substrate-binding protein